MGWSRSLRAQERSARAAERTEELTALRLRLAAGERLTSEDVELARRRALESRVWANESLLRAADAHHRAATARLAAAETLAGAGRDDRAAAHRTQAGADLADERSDREAAPTDRADDVGAPAREH